jgi:nucleotide-binding universal stress UspA family protein
MNGAGYCPTGRLEKLLLATDTSLYSEGAVREAINFAKKCKSKLYAMSVIEMFTEMETLGKNVYEQEEIRVGKHLEEIKARAAAEGVGCEVLVHFSDSPHVPIVEEAREKKVDMIILGRRGTKGLAKLLIGEVASKVIGSAPCDVLIVPRAARIEYKHILVATDGSAHAKAAVAKAVDIAKRCGGSVIALSAVRDESERKEAEQYVAEAAGMAGKEGVPIETMTPTGRSFNVIVETAGGRGVDLIVMGTYGRTGIKKALMGSATEKVIGSAGCGVLVVK